MGDKKKINWYFIGPFGVFIGIIIFAFGVHLHIHIKGRYIHNAQMEAKKFCEARYYRIWEMSSEESGLKLQLSPWEFTEGQIKVSLNKGYLEEKKEAKFVLQPRRVKVVIPKDHPDIVLLREVAKIGNSLRVSVRSNRHGDQTNWVNHVYIYEIYNLREEGSSVKRPAQE